MARDGLVLLDLACCSMSLGFRMDARLQLLCPCFRVSKLLLQLVLCGRATAFLISIVRDDARHLDVGLILQTARQTFDEIQQCVAERAFMCHAALFLIQLFEVLVNGGLRPGISQCDTYGVDRWVDGLGQQAVASLPYVRFVKSRSGHKISAKFDNKTRNT